MVSVSKPFSMVGRYWLIYEYYRSLTLPPWWSRWPRGLRRGSAAFRLLGLWVRIPPEEWMSVCCECCVFLSRGLCVGLITHPEESYRVWCAWVCLWIPDNEEALAHMGLLRHGEINASIYRTEYLVFWGHIKTDLMCTKHIPWKSETIMLEEKMKTDSWCVKKQIQKLPDLHILVYWRSQRKRSSVA